MCFSPKGLRLILFRGAETEDYKTGMFCDARLLLDSFFFNSFFINRLLIQVVSVLFLPQPLLCNAGLFVSGLLAACVSSSSQVCIKIKLQSAKKQVLRWKQIIRNTQISVCLTIG